MPPKAQPEFQPALVEISASFCQISASFQSAFSQENIVNYKVFANFNQLLAPKAAPPRPPRVLQPMQVSKMPSTIPPKAQPEFQPAFPRGPWGVAFGAKSWLKFAKTL